MTWVDISPPRLLANLRDIFRGGVVLDRWYIKQIARKNGLGWTPEWFDLPARDRTTFPAVVPLLYLLPPAKRNGQLSIRPLPPSTQSWPARLLTTTVQQNGGTDCSCCCSHTLYANGSTKSRSVPAVAL